MIKEYKLEDIKADGFLHSRIYEFIYNPEKKVFKVNFGFGDLKEGGALVDCTITIADWWNVITSFTRNSKELNIDGLAGLISKNPIDSAIYEYIIDESDITLNGHVSDCLFSLKFTKPKIQITGEYDPD